ncbi:hypothetical protein LTR84_004741 [Exophiala bonariae]|uniref:Uncharacterized protein n=1 Tax=Exophiala bonariae TaxID=1690606 RepID=A0AAV9NNR3_9EURO|nr:hypothetical protein LTR84_004741 [Exophiala bonariae]
MAPRSRRPKPQTQQVKDTDAAVNEALLAHADFTRSAKLWLSAALGGDQDGANDHNENQPTSKPEVGENPKTEDKLNSLKPAGEEFNSDMNGLGYIPPKDSSGRPVTTSSNDPTTAFLRKQLLGWTRPQHPPSNGQTNRPKASGSVRKDDSDEEDSRSRRSKGKQPPRKSAPAASPLETDDGTPTGITNRSDEMDKEEQPEPRLNSPGPITTHDAEPSHLPTKKPTKRPASYLDQVLAERERKKNKKKKK